jgi:phospholipid-binding lipoprotein MlaA
MKKHQIASVLLVLMLLACGGCATPPRAGAAGARNNPGDPLEPLNRTVYRFNDTLDRNIAVPAAKAYVKITPSPIRTAIKNFFSNIGDIGNFANNLLQGNITAGVEDLIRVGMNSTFGIGGLIDFASQAQIPRNDQDFGLTLGHWGVPAGPYLVLPLFGPSTVRDAAGRAVDIELLDPTGFLPFDARAVLFGVNIVNVRAQYLGATDLLAEAALDKYTFERDAYLQRRQHLLGHDKSDASLPDYGDQSDLDKSSSSAEPASGAAAAGPTAVPPGSGPAAAPSAAPNSPASGAAATQ